MCGEKEKGEISQKVHYEIEWSIKDIFSYTVKDSSLDSPTFSVPGSQWFLRIYPYGQSIHSSVGWISLYLRRESDDMKPPKNVIYDLGVKKVAGNVEVITHGNDVFEAGSYGWGTTKFLSRSKLLERRSELAPSGTVTLTCTLRMTDGWDCTSRLIELSSDFENMLIAKRECDTTLKVRDKEFSVNKSVLSLRSMVFETMFQAEMKEKTSGVVDIADCHPEAFKDFLVYIYSGNFQNSAGDVFELYKIAHKYCAESLKAACVHFMMNNLSVDNVLDVSITGYLFDEPELMSKSQEYFKEHFADVVLTGKWGSFFKENPTLANDLIMNVANGMKIKENEKK